MARVSTDRSGGLAILEVIEGGVGVTGDDAIVADPLLTTASLPCFLLEISEISLRWVFPVFLTLPAEIARTLQ